MRKTWNPINTLLGKAKKPTIPSHMHYDNLKLSTDYQKTKKIQSIFC